MQRATCPKCQSTRTPMIHHTGDFECTLPTCRHRWRGYSSPPPPPAAHEVFTPLAPAPDMTGSPAPAYDPPSAPSADYSSDSGSSSSDGGGGYSGGGGDSGGGGASGDW